jgi:hypothetical protein
MWLNEGGPSDDNIYRILIHPTTKHVEVTCVGLEKVDAQAEGVYRSTNLLPDWMQEKLAVLTMMSAEPPTKIVEGIGRRIDHDRYWVFC